MPRRWPFGSHLRFGVWKRKKKTLCVGWLLLQTEECYTPKCVKALFQIITATTSPVQNHHFDLTTPLNHRRGCRFIEHPFFWGVQNGREEVWYGEVRWMLFLKCARSAWYPLWPSLFRTIANVSLHQYFILSDTSRNLDIHNEIHEILAMPKQHIYRLHNCEAVSKQICIFAFSSRHQGHDSSLVRDPLCMYFPFLVL